MHVSVYAYFYENTLKEVRLLSSAVIKEHQSTLCGGKPAPAFALSWKSFVDLSSLCHHMKTRKDGIPQILQGFYLNLLSNDIKTKATNKSSEMLLPVLCAMKDYVTISSLFLLLLLKMDAQFFFYFKHMNSFFFKKDKIVHKCAKCILVTLYKMNPKL